jgi:hypothetical protein
MEPFVDAHLNEHLQQIMIISNIGLFVFVYAVVKVQNLLDDLAIAWRFALGIQISEEVWTLSANNLSGINLMSCLGCWWDAVLDKMGHPGLEPGTSRLSSVRSNRLS